MQKKKKNRRKNYYYSSHKPQIKSESQWERFNPFQPFSDYFAYCFSSVWEIKCEENKIFGFRSVCL